MADVYDEDFEPDRFVEVWTHSMEQARTHFDAPPHWPCKAIRTRDDGVILYRLQADGLEIE